MHLVKEKSDSRTKLKKLRIQTKKDQEITLCIFYAESTLIFSIYFSFLKALCWQKKEKFPKKKLSNFIEAMLR